ncbi:MAG: hypothetical protein II272_04975, partial [Oscillospiraceae bacterium]|nr:hypothetical protein [Oscillospiraceae bacterium]
IADYCNRQKEFHNYTEFLNVWLRCQRTEEETKQQKAILGWKTGYRLFVALLYGSYPMSVRFSYGLTEGRPKGGCID